MITPELTQLATQLADVIARNAASAVLSKISAIRARKLDQETMNELITIAMGFEQELVAQRISQDDIDYITTPLIPVAEQLIGLAAEDQQSKEALEAIKSLITPEMLTIMQLFGFNFRRAIGEPLTTLVERLILSRMPAPEQNVDLQALHCANRQRTSRP